MKKIVLISVLLVLIFAFSPLQMQPVFVHMQTKSLVKGNFVKVEADIFFNQEKGELTTHYLYPQESVFISNRFGEAKIYYPEKNEIILKQSTLFSSQNHMLFYFINNQVFDLGLADMGFTLNKTFDEEGLLVSTWKPPIFLLDKIKMLKIVYENQLPIYSAYVANNDKIIKKIYYSDYSVLEQFSLPMRITEIDYLANGDSTVSLQLYSDFRFEYDLNNPYLNYKIPENAKVVK